MDWTNILITFITSGAFTTMYFLGDKKTANVLDNVSKTISQWRDLVGEIKGELTEQRDETRKSKEDYEASLKAKDNKIDSLYKEISILRDRSDKLSSNVARLQILKCLEMGCKLRRPPIGSQSQEKAEELKQD